MSTLDPGKKKARFKLNRIRFRPPDPDSHSQRCSSTGPSPEAEKMEPQTSGEFINNGDEDQISNGQDAISEVSEGVPQDSEDDVNSVGATSTNLAESLDGRVIDEDSTPERSRSSSPDAENGDVCPEESVGSQLDLEPENSEGVPPADQDEENSSIVGCVEMDNQSKEDGELSDSEEEDLHSVVCSEAENESLGYIKDGELSEDKEDLDSFVYSGSEKEVSQDEGAKNQDENTENLSDDQEVSAGESNVVASDEEGECEESEKEVSDDEAGAKPTSDNVEEFGKKRDGDTEDENEAGIESEKEVAADGACTEQDEIDEEEVRSVNADEAEEDADEANIEQAEKEEVHSVDSDEAEKVEDADNDCLQSDADLDEVNEKELDSGAEMRSTEKEEVCSVNSDDVGEKEGADVEDENDAGMASCREQDEIEEEVRSVNAGEAEEVAEDADEVDVEQTEKDEVHSVESDEAEKLEEADNGCSQSDADLDEVNEKELDSGAAMHSTEKDEVCSVNSDAVGEKEDEDENDAGMVSCGEQDEIEEEVSSVNADEAEEVDERADADEADVEQVEKEEVHSVESDEAEKVEDADDDCSQSNADEKELDSGAEMCGTDVPEEKAESVREPEDVKSKMKDGDDVGPGEFEKEPVESVYQLPVAHDKRVPLDEAVESPSRTSPALPAQTSVDDNSVQNDPEELDSVGNETTKTGNFDSPTKKVWNELVSEVARMEEASIDNHIKSLVDDFKSVDHKTESEETEDSNLANSESFPASDTSISLPKTFPGFKPKKRTFNVDFPIPMSFRPVVEIPDVIRSMKNVSGNVYCTPDIVTIDPVVLKRHYESKKNNRKKTKLLLQKEVSEQESPLPSKVKAGVGSKKGKDKGSLVEKCVKGKSLKTKSEIKKEIKGKASKVEPKKHVKGQPTKSEPEKDSKEKKESTTKKKGRPKLIKTEASESVKQDKKPSRKDSVDDVSIASDLPEQLPATPISKADGIFSSHSARSTPVPEQQPPSRPSTPLSVHGGGRGTLNQGGGNVMMNRRWWWEESKKKARKYKKKTVGDEADVSSICSSETPNVQARARSPSCDSEISSVSTADRQDAGLSVKKEKKPSQSEMKIPTKVKVPKKICTDPIKNIWNLMSMGHSVVQVERCATDNLTVKNCIVEKGDIDGDVDIEGEVPIDNLQSSHRVTKRGRKEESRKSSGNETKGARLGKFADGEGDLNENESSEDEAPVHSDSDVEEVGISYEDFLKEQDSGSKVEMSKSPKDKGKEESEKLTPKKRGRPRKEPVQKAEGDSEVPVQEKSIKGVENEDEIPSSKKSSGSVEKKRRLKNDAEPVELPENASVKQKSKDDAGLADEGKLPPKKGKRGRPKKELGHTEESKLDKPEGDKKGNTKGHSVEPSEGDVKPDEPEIASAKKSPPNKKRGRPKKETSFTEEEKSRQPKEEEKGDARGLSIERAEEGSVKVDVKETESATAEKSSLKKKRGRPRKETSRDREKRDDDERKVGAPLDLEKKSEVLHQVSDAENSEGTGAVSDRQVEDAVVSLKSEEAQEKTVLPATTEDVHVQDASENEKAGKDSERKKQKKKRKRSKKSEENLPEFSSDDEVVGEKPQKRKKNRRSQPQFNPVLPDFSSDEEKETKAVEKDFDKISSMKKNIVNTTDSDSLSIQKVHDKVGKNVHVPDFSSDSSSSQAKSLAWESAKTDEKTTAEKSTEEDQGDEKDGLKLTINSLVEKPELWSESDEESYQKGSMLKKKSKANVLASDSDGELAVIARSKSDEKHHKKDRKEKSKSKERDKNSGHSSSKKKEEKSEKGSKEIDWLPKPSEKASSDSEKIQTVACPSSDSDVFADAGGGFCSGSDIGGFDASDNNEEVKDSTEIQPIHVDRAKVEKLSDKELLEKYQSVIKPVEVAVFHLKSKVRRILRKRKYIRISKFEHMTGVKIGKTRPQKVENLTDAERAPSKLFVETISEKQVSETESETRHDIFGTEKDMAKTEKERHRSGSKEKHRSEKEKDKSERDRHKSEKERHKSEKERHKSEKERHKSEKERHKSETDGRKSEKKHKVEAERSKSEKEKHKIEKDKSEKERHRSEKDQDKSRKEKSKHDKERSKSESKSKVEKEGSKIEKEKENVTVEKEKLTVEEEKTKEGQPDEETEKDAESKSEKLTELQDEVEPDHDTKPEFVRSTSKTSSLHSDTELQVLDEVGGDSSDDGSEVVRAAESSDEERPKKVRKIALESDSDSDAKESKEKSEDVKKSDLPEVETNKKSSGDESMRKVKKEDTGKPKEKESKTEVKKRRSSQEDSKKMKPSKKKQKSSASLNELLFGAPVFGETVAPSISTFKIPRRKSEAEKRKQNVDLESKKRSRFSDVSDSEKEPRKRSRWEDVMDTAKPQSLGKDSGRSQDPSRERKDSGRSLDPSRERKESFGDRGVGRRDSTSDRRDSRSERRDSDRIDSASDWRDPFNRKEREADQRNRREKEQSRPTREGSRFAESSARDPRSLQEDPATQRQNLMPPKKEIQTKPPEKSAPTNSSHPIPRTYKEYRESLKRSAQSGDSTPPSDECGKPEALTSTPLQKLPRESLKQRDEESSRVLQHAREHGMPSPIEHSSPSDIGSHDFIGPHTPDMPEVDDGGSSDTGSQENSGIEASVYSLLMADKDGKADELSPDDPRRKSSKFKAPLPVQKGCKKEGGRQSELDRLVLSAAADDSEETEEWFDSMMATMGEDEEDEDVLSLCPPSEYSVTEDADRIESERSGKPSPVPTKKQTSKQNSPGVGVTPIQRSLAKSSLYNFLASQMDSSETDNDENTMEHSGATDNVSNQKPGGIVLGPKSSPKVASALHMPLMQSIMFAKLESQGQNSRQEHYEQSEASIIEERNLKAKALKEQRELERKLEMEEEEARNFKANAEKEQRELERKLERQLDERKSFVQKVLNPRITNYKIRRNIPPGSGYCFKFVKFMCNNPRCRFNHVIPPELVIEDLKEAVQGEDLVRASEIYAFLKKKCGEKETRYDIILDLIELSNKKEVFDMVTTVLLPDIKKNRILNTEICDALIDICFPKHTHMLWDMFVFFTQYGDPVTPSENKILSLLRGLFLRHDFEKVLLIIGTWSTLDIQLAPILELALTSDTHLNGTGLLIDNLPEKMLKNIEPQLLHDLKDRCLQGCHPHGAQVIQRAIDRIHASQKPPEPPPEPEEPVNKKEILKELHEQVKMVLEEGKLKEAVEVFHKMLAINNQDNMAARNCGIDMNFLFNQMLMAAVQKMDTTLLLTIFNIGSSGSMLNPREAMYRLLIIHCVRSNNDHKADLLYKMSPAIKPSVISIPRFITINSNLSKEEIRIMMKSYLLDLCRLFRASNKPSSSKNIEDYVIDVIVKKVDTNAGGVKILAQIVNSVDAVGQRILNVCKHFNPPLIAKLDPATKKIDISPESIKLHLKSLEKLCLKAAKGIVFGAKNPKDTAKGMPPPPPQTPQIS